MYSRVKKKLPGNVNNKFLAQKTQKNSKCHRYYYYFAASLGTLEKIQEKIVSFKIVTIDWEYDC